MRFPRRLAIMGSCAASVLVAPFATADSMPDPLTKAVCDEVAALGPEGIEKASLVARDKDNIKGDINLRIDIDGDGTSEQVFSKYEPTTMHPRLWFVHRRAGGSYLKPDNRSIYLPDIPGVLQPEQGYDIAWIRLRGQVFALEVGDERYHFAGELFRFREGKTEALCKFETSVALEWSRAERAPEDVCRLATEKKWNELGFAPTRREWSERFHPPTVETGSAEERTIDLDDDGKRDALVRWYFASGAGRGCDFKWIDTDPEHPNPRLRRQLLDAQGFQKSPDGAAYPYDVFPRDDEFGWTRCGDVNDIVDVGGHLFVRANDRLTSLTAGVNRTVCKGKRTYVWHVAKYLE